MKMSAIEIRALTNKDKKNNMNSYNQSLAISRKITDNILKANARNIAKLQVVDEENNEINKELIKPLVRVLRRSPQSYDFIVNLIQNLAENNGMKKRLDGDKINGHYLCEVTLNDFEAFLKRCKSYTVRQIVKRQLLWNLSSSQFIISETKEEIRKFRPYYMYDWKMNKKSGEWTGQIMFAKTIFKGIITGDHGPEGYVRIPRYLFPNVTHTDKHHLESYNPIYRAIVYANTKNTNHKKKMHIKLPEFLESVLPEYLNRNNSLKVELDKCEYSLNKALETLNDKIIKEGLLLNHLSFDKKEDRATLYYRLPRSA
jgi:hypothetical protein